MIVIHPSWVYRVGAGRVNQDMLAIGLYVTAPPGKKWFEAVPTQPKVETLADEILKELRRG